MASTPVTFYLESDNELGAAFLMLSNARDYLDEFARTHPDRVDDNVQQALAHAQNACSLLDADFYTEHNADPPAEPIDDLDWDNQCGGHPAGPHDPMGQTVYCDGSCQS